MHLVKLFFLRGFGAISSILVTLFITNSFVVESASKIIYFITLVTVLGVIMTLGSSDFLLKKTSENVNENKSGINKYITQVFILVFLLFVISFLFLAITNLFIGDIENFGITYFYYLVLLSSFFYGIILILSSIFFGLRRAILGSFIQSFLMPFMFLCLSYLYSTYYELTLDYILNFYMTSQFLVIIYALFLAYKEGFRFVKIESLDKKTLTSLYFFLTTIVMQQFTLWSGQLIVANQIGTVEMSYLSIAQRITIVVNFVILTINMLYAPKFSFLFHKEKKIELKNTVKQACIFIAVISMPLLMIIFIFADFIVSLFGPDYTSAIILIRILIVGQVINIMTGPAGYLLNMTGYERDMRNISLFTGISSVIITIFLVYVYGEIGAAVSITFLVSLQNILAAYYVYKRLGINIIKVYK